VLAIDGSAGGAAVALAGSPRSHLGWLVQLRWVAVVGQLATVLAVRGWYGIALPLAPLVAAIALTAASNVALLAWSGRAPLDRPQAGGGRAATAMLAILVLDLVVLTFLLYWTGGPTNPCFLFYFVNLVVCGILLPPRQAWILCGLSAVCFAGLCVHSIPVAALRDPRNLRSIWEAGLATQAQQGLLAAFLLCGGVIVHFVTKLTGAMRRQQDQLRDAELKRALARRWESLGTLAAGAAHELATPLSTIAVAATELERHVQEPGASVRDAAEFVEIRQALGRCRAILNRMSLDAGRVALEERSTIAIEELARDLAESFPHDAPRLQIRVQSSGEATLEGPREGLNQALRSFVQNALDASPEGTPVRVALAAEESEMVIVVADQGVGMSPEVLEHADEPFFTTKQAGEGMGLGRFLARQVVRHLGGRLHTESAPGAGTTVEVRLPLHSAGASHE